MGVNKNPGRLAGILYVDVSQLFSLVSTKAFPASF
jgi:hypothetical protein